MAVGVTGRILMLAMLGSLACSSASSRLGGRDGGWVAVPGDGSVGVDVRDAGPDESGVIGLPAPRLVAPLSTATVTSRRPTLRWALAGGTDGAHVQICSDRACKKVVTSFDATRSGTPADALPPGVLFWRAFGRSDGASGRVSSPTWEFTVGVLSAPVDTSWGTKLDVNGDGYADVIVSAPYAENAVGQAFVYLGSASGLASSPQLTLTGPDGQNGFGIWAASAGDVNGDGYGDVVVSNAGTAAYLYLGGAAGLSASPLKLTPPPGTARGFGIHVASAGDVNGDGYADVLVGDNVAGLVFLYLGSATGPASLPDVTLTAPGGQSQGVGEFGHSVESAGDVNGDGYADVAVGTGRVYLFLGSPTGLASSPAVTLAEPGVPSGSYGRLSCAGDVNGDGYADLVVSSDAAGTGFAGRAYIYLGGPAGYSSAPDATLESPDGPGGTFGRLVSGAGDVNGDGYADVIIGADAESPGLAGVDGGVGGPAGWAHIYLGSAAGLTSSPAVTLTGPDGPSTWFGRSVAGPGDVNGDGYADVLVGADAERTGAAGWAHLYLGSATGPATSPASTLTGPAAGSRFGYSVARADVESTTAPSRRLEVTRCRSRSERTL